jgi:hypothetical protein
MSEWRQVLGPWFISSELKINRNGQDAQDFRFSIFDWRFEAERHKTQIKNLKSKILKGNGFDEQ